MSGMLAPETIEESVSVDVAYGHRHEDAPHARGLEVEAPVTEVALIGDAILVAVAAPPGREVAIVGEEVRIAVRLALVGKVVPVAVEAPPLGDIAGVVEAVRVAVLGEEVAGVGNKVVVAVGAVGDHRADEQVDLARLPIEQRDLQVAPLEEVARGHAHRPSAGPHVEDAADDPARVVPEERDGAAGEGIVRVPCPRDDDVEVTVPVDVGEGARERGPAGR
jgi:hypothetical protein